MHGDKRHLSAEIFAGLAAGSSVVGWCMHDFYEWTGSNQSTPSPLLWQMPLGLAVTAMAFCCCLPWMPIAYRDGDAEPAKPFRFSIKALLALTSFVAVVAALVPLYPIMVARTACVASLAVFAWSASRDRRHWLPALALLACMHLPFLWIIRFEGAYGLSMLATLIVNGMPTAYPAAWIGRAFDQSMRETQLAAVILTGVQLAFGAWLIRKGPKQTITLSIIALILCSGSSLLFYQLYRM